MSEVVRALRPFKVQIRVGEFLHFKTGDRIPHHLLTGPYRDYVMGHCEIAQTKVHIPVAEPTRTVEATAKLTQTPPPLKEQWKNVKAPIEKVTAESATGLDQWASDGGKEPETKQSVKAGSTPHGGAAMAKGAHAPQTGAASHKAPAKGHPTGKAKPHA